MFGLSIGSNEIELNAYKFVDKTEEGVKIKGSRTDGVDFSLLPFT